MSSIISTPNNTEKFYNSPLINMNSVPQETYVTGEDEQKEIE